MAITLADLSFYFYVQELKVQYVNEQPRLVRQDWYPPKRKQSVRPRGEPFLLKWRGGRLENVANPGAQSYQNLPQFGPPVTAFTQHNLKRLIFVDFDASQRDLDLAHERDYAVLSFSHQVVPNSSRMRSFADPNLGIDCIAGRARSDWMPQLIPEINRWRPQNAQQQQAPDHDGIIGRLAILMALAAFAGKRDVAKEVMINCVRPREWRNQTNLSNGRAQERRGMVVKIFRDPGNPNSNSAQLKKLEKGDFGVFYN